jgi:hypothetical protein
MADIRERLAERARELPPGAWIRAWGYDQTRLDENRHPTRWDLDVATPDHPVLLDHVSGHVIAVNSKVLELAGVTRDTADVPGGEIERDEHGEPTGVFNEDAMALIYDILPELGGDEIRPGIPAAREEFLSRGITAIHDATPGDMKLIQIYAEAIRSGEIPFRVLAMVSAETHDNELEGQSGDIGPSLGLPPGRLVTGPTKFLHDGAIQSYTAALSQPYYDEPERYGVKIYDPAVLHEVVLKEHRKGRQVAIHGNGDAAIEDIIDAYEAALLDTPRENHRHRIEHLQTAREDQIERMARLGIVSSVFINHLWVFGDRHLSRFLGPERAERMEPLASLTRRGIKWGLHCDYSVTDVNPLLGIWLAVNRRTSGGQPIGEEQKVGVEQALRGFGPDAAYLGFQEEEMGTIKPGFMADFVVLESDPVADPESIKDIAVLQTVVAGEVVWEA